MVIDILMLNIIIISAIFYGWRGTGLTVFSMIKWTVSAAAAAFLAIPFTNWAIANTGMENGIVSSLESKMADGVFRSGVFKAIPTLFDDLTDQVLTSSVSETATVIAKISFMILVFLVLLLMIKGILTALTFRLKKEHTKGIMAGLDTAGGAILGGISGLFFILVILMFIVYLCTVLPDGAADSLQSAVNGSHFTRTLYNDNYLLQLLNQFVSGS